MYFFQTFLPLEHLRHCLATHHRGPTPLPCLISQDQVIKIVYMYTICVHVVLPYPSCTICLKCVFPPGNSYSSSQPSLLGSFAPPTFAPASQTTPIVPLLNPPPGGFPPGLTSFPPTFTSQATPPQQRIPPTQPTPPQLRAPTQPVQATPPQSTSDPFAGLGLLSTPVDPLAVLDNTFVPMETIQTGEWVWSKMCT